jgi:hypothetical protein
VLGAWQLLCVLLLPRACLPEALRALLDLHHESTQHNKPSKHQYHTPPERADAPRSAKKQQGHILTLGQLRFAAVLYMCAF